MIRAILCVIVLAALIPKSLLAQNALTERIHFPREATSTSVSGTINEHESVNYIFGATTGQSVSVVLNSDNLGNYFNIYEPGKFPGEDYAMFIGATEGNRFQGTLLTEGDYMVQVYIIRSAARRGETARYTLELSLLSDEKK